MESSEQVVDADPNGDVSLLIGDPSNANTLRVSSKALSLASPVLAALVSPKYAEGMALSSSTDVRQIALPDDDPEALILICHALHHRRITPRQISFELLGKAAVICDKYDMATGLTPWSELWVQQWKVKGSGFAHWSKMLCLSSTFGSDETFYLSSKELMSSCAAAKSPPMKIEDKEIKLSNAEDVFNSLDQCVSSTNEVCKCDVVRVSTPSYYPLHTLCCSLERCGQARLISFPHREFTESQIFLSVCIVSPPTP